MPVEDRRIHFSNEELYKALYAFCFQKQVRQPPPGHITKVAEDSLDHTKVLFVLENPQDRTGTTLEYSHDFLAAALMLYCRSCGIPLPKSGRKSVVIQGSEVILRVQI
jgi:hypothetical protein